MSNKKKCAVLFFYIYSSCVMHAAIGSEFNYGFLQGVSNVPVVFRNNKDKPKGRYLVDVYYNNESVGRSELIISKEEEEQELLCFSKEWMSNLDINIDLGYYNDFFSEKGNCYQIEREANTQVDFDFNSQSIHLSVPQAYQLKDTDPSLWDYGIPGGKLTYYANFLKNSQDDGSSIFSNFDANVNVGEWVLSSNFNLSNGVGRDKFSARDMMLSRAVDSISGDVILGKTNTRNELFPDFGFYGLSARSNLNMKPWSARGYAPLVSGVAPSTSRVTVAQNNNVIYSKVVPPGPYSIDDVNPTGNGDLTITVEDASGNKTVTRQAVATLPTLLRSGSFNYNFAIGRKEASKNLDDPFMFGAIDYGFSFSTISIASILHRNYQSLGVGVTSNLGRYGAFFFSSNIARAEYVEGEKVGKSFSIKYSKSVGDSTDVQLLAYRYQDDDYVDFVDYDSSVQSLRKDKRERYEAMLSHDAGGFYLSSSAWLQTYRNTDSNDLGINLSANTTTSSGISVNLSAAYSKMFEYEKADYSLSVGLSIPFDVGDVTHYGTTGFNYNRGGSPSFNAGVSASNERLNYSINSDLSADGNNITANVGYGFDRIQTNVTVARGNGHSSLSGSASGSVIITKPTGIVFSREQSDTVAVVEIPDIKGVKFGESTATNAAGITALYLSDYTRNDISIDTENIPNNVELLHSSYKVVPTEKAIIYRKFDFERIQRFILRVLDKQGKALHAGYSVVTGYGENAGFVANNGVVLMSLKSKPEAVRIVDNSGKFECRVNMASVKENLNKVQEVRCE
ncbi:PefC/AfrB family outer membrane usher protein [Shewanella algae]|uniref:PefC/AfrB family outer membrane usher protein n=1 Tax=Shewanella algae TaxID=38313 RepID=UPI001AAC9C0E|nr:PefC/AfrB family outer membrane usher protein [Shewanella algae]MBO2656074.1 PefC/AfrB family outer membrane usher protein [Shewanella algae]